MGLCARVVITGSEKAASREKCLREFAPEFRMTLLKAKRLVIVASADELIELFNEARAKPAGIERERFVAEACGSDPRLMEQVLSLLKAEADEGASDFLRHTPPIRSAALVTEKPGDKIGRYKLLQQLGEGGCGVVYMAEQLEPVHRRVARRSSPRIGRARAGPRHPRGCDTSACQDSSP